MVLSATSLLLNVTRFQRWQRRRRTVRHQCAGAHSDSGDEFIAMAMTRLSSSSAFSSRSAGMTAGSVGAVMTADDVLSVLALFRTAAVDVWVGGGWGIDALVGRETRPHRDLDLMHRMEQEPTVMAALAAAGFAETLDWRPVRFVVADPAGREIDLHPLTFAPDGSAVQASLEPDRPFAYPARCFSPAGSAVRWSLAYRLSSRSTFTGVRADGSRPPRHGSASWGVRHRHALLNALSG